MNDEQQPKRPAGRKPDYEVSALHKVTEERGNIGGAWINEDDTISIKLNPFLTITSKDLVITLFPKK